METTWERKWLCHDLVRDLQRYGLEDFEIIEVYANAVIGRAMGEYIKIEWKENAYCIVTMQKYLPSIASTFEEVLEIPPLAVYIKQGLVVVEFERENPGKRAKELMNERDRGVIQEIRRLL